MYSRRELSIEIRALIEALDKANVSVINPDWLTNEIMSRHQAISGDDAEFYTCLARQEVRNEVRRQFGKRYKDDGQNLEADSQLIMPGFEHLQKRYLIKQNGEMVAIRLPDMTYVQVMSKVREYRRLGDGNHKHGDELERYAAELMKRG